MNSDIKYQEMLARNSNIKQGINKFEKQYEKFQNNGNGKKKQGLYHQIQ